MFHSSQAMLSGASQKQNWHVETGFITFPLLSCIPYHKRSNSRIWIPTSGPSQWKADTCSVERTLQLSGCSLAGTLLGGFLWATEVIGQIPQVGKCSGKLPSTFIRILDKKYRLYGFPQWSLSQSDYTKVWNVRQPERTGP